MHLWFAAHAGGGCWPRGVADRPCRGETHIDKMQKIEEKLITSSIERVIRCRGHEKVPFLTMKTPVRSKTGLKVVFMSKSKVILSM